MNNCPVGYNSNSSRYMVIENFSDKCDASLVPHDSSQDSNNTYLNTRNKNISDLDKNYKRELSNFLNNYNTYLLNRSMLRNSPPGSPSQSQLAMATENSKKKYIQSRDKLKKIQNNIEKNNKDTNSIIKAQNNTINSKQKKIKEKDLSIKQQSVLIDEKTKILNSRIRQIELGVQKNIYKRNIMWLYVVLNIFLILVVVSLITYISTRNKN